MRKVDVDDPRPPYQQVADDLRSEIRAGTLAPGQRLAKQPDLAEGYGVSIGTLKSALGVLREERLIVSRQGEGSWVCRELPEPSPARANDGSPGGPTVEHMMTEALDRLTEISERLETVERRLEQR